MNRRILCLSILTLLLLACDDRLPPEEANALAIGDSIFDWNRSAGPDQSIPHFVGQGLGLQLSNASVGGSTLLGEDPDKIPNQYVSKAWDFVLLDGGGNDLSQDAGCRADLIDELINEDASEGVMVTLIDKMLADGAKTIVLLGYYGMPEGGPVKPCEDALEALEVRYAALAELRPNVMFLDPSEVIDGSDTSDFDPDLLHPSVSGGQKVANFIVREVQEASR